MKVQMSTAGDLLLRQPLWLRLSISLFVLCFITDSVYVLEFTPATVITSFEEPHQVAAEPGGYWFMIGLFGLAGLAIPTIFPWLANPLLIIAWRLYAKRNSTIGPFIVSLVALSLMLSFLSFDTYSWFSTHYEIIGYGPGYGFWVSSALTMLIPSIFQYLSNRSQNNASQDGTSNTQT